VCYCKVALSKWNKHYIDCNSPTQKKDSDNSNNNNNNINKTRNMPLSASNNFLNRHTFKCPYCQEPHLTSNDLIFHTNKHHLNADPRVVCPICVAMPWGDPNYVSENFQDHLNTRHRFDYDYFVDFEKNDDEMLQTALENSVLIK
jgi:E3 ubiquitin-protein ligase RNF138